MVHLTAALLGLLYACSAYASPGLHPRESAEELNRNGPPGGEILHRRTYFYVGGQYDDSTANASTRKNQMYAERLTPERVSKSNPVVFFHGGGGQGSIWLNTPDNRKGWASYFMEKGYEVYLVDVSFVGRSNRPSTIPAVLASQQLVQNVFTAPERVNPLVYPQAALHNKWPGSGVRGDPIFDAFLDAFTQTPLNFVDQEAAVATAGCALLEKIGRPTFLVAHSLGGVFPIVIGNRCPQRIKGFVGVEPDQTPFQSCNSGSCVRGTRPWGLTNGPLTYSPAVTDPTQITTTTIGPDSAANHSCIVQTDPPRKLTQLAQVPVLVITGEASIHITYDHCQVYYMRQAGISVVWTLLADRNIRGNGHFSYIEQNNLRVADVVLDWISGRSS